MRKTLFYILFFLFPCSLFSQITWNGGNGSWDVAANWTPATVPTSADVVIFNTGTSVVSGTTGQAASIDISNADITLNFDLNIGNLSSTNVGIILNNGATVTFGTGTFSILNDGVFDGISSLAADTLNVSSNAVLNIGQSDNGINMPSAHLLNNGSVNIVNYNSTGIFMDVNSSCNNNGVITINTPALTADPNGSGLEANGIFRNKATGTITVTDANTFSLFIRGTFRNRGNIDTDIQTNTSSGDASIKIQNANMTNFDTGIINANAITGNTRPIFLNLTTFNNFGEINVSGGRADQSFHLRTSTLNNDSCNAVINLIGGRLNVGTDGVFTNNAYITSSYTDSGIHTQNSSGTATNNGFFSYTTNSTVFATGLGVIMDNGYTGPVSQATCEGDTDCSNGDEVWNAILCLCEHSNIPDPSTCIDDGDCANGEETWNTTTCVCEQLNIPDKSFIR